ncbi:MAG: hypothetical protein K2J71_01910 [Oscillospiraceae bacterium]|nr:hypothetical protein [Oscillospiraceae bacterium]
MAYLNIGVSEEDLLAVSRISGYDLSNFSLKNQFTSESGHTITYPVRMQKKRIAVTAEIYGDEYEEFMKILENPEFFCIFRNPDGEKSGYFMVTSDISVTKILNETSETSALYAISFTIEEV